MERDLRYVRCRVSVRQLVRSLRCHHLQATRKAAAGVISEDLGRSLDDLERPQSML